MPTVSPTAVLPSISPTIRTRQGTTHVAHVWTTWTAWSWLRWKPLSPTDRTTLVVVPPLLARTHDHHHKGM